MVPVVIVGAGPQGLGHGRSWPKVGGAVKAVVDIDMDKAERAALALGGKAYRSLAEALESTDRPCIVDIVTPPSTHVALAQEAIRQGAHALVEKPLALDPGELAALDGEGTRTPSITVMHNWLYEPPVREALARWEAGEIGDLVHIHVSIVSTPRDPMLSDPGHWVHRLPAGRVHETLPHACYLVGRFLPGCRVEYAGLGRLADLPWSGHDTLTACLGDGRRRASILISFAGAREAVTLELIGTRGQLRVHLLEALVESSYVTGNPLELSRASRLAAVLGQVGNRLTAIGRNSWRLATRSWLPGHEYIMRGIIQHVLRGTPLPVTWEEAKRTVQLTADVAAYALGAARLAEGRDGNLQGAAPQQNEG